MERIHAGDSSALAQVLDRFWAPLVSYARRILPDGDEAEDIVQETMVRLWDRRAEWTPSQQLQGFLYRITRNLALNEQKRARVRSQWISRSSQEPPNRPPTPLDLAERVQLRETLEEAIASLPPRRREVFILARYHGHSYREIAEIMDISPQTVANHMTAALEELRVRLRQEMDAFARGELSIPLSARPPVD
jgi:RNA polymerase sigma-70 factor (ECF subfamily)